MTVFARWYIRLQDANGVDAWITVDRHEAGRPPTREPGVSPGEDRDRAATRWAGRILGWGRSGRHVSRKLIPLSIRIHVRYVDNIQRASRQHVLRQHWRPQWRAVVPSQRASARRSPARPGELEDILGRRGNRKVVFHRADF